MAEHETQTTEPDRWTQEWVQWVRNRGFCSDIPEWNRLCDLALEAAGTGELTRRLQLLNVMEKENSDLRHRLTGASTDGENKSTELRLILSMAPSFQGGHSKIGGEVADYLGIPFPLTTSNLEKKAKACGFNPYDLWPWLRRIREQRGQGHSGGDCPLAEELSRPPSIGWLEARPGVRAGEEVEAAMNDQTTQTDTTAEHVDDLNDPVLRALAKEHDLWLEGVRWALGDVSKHDLEMLAEDQGGERAAPGPDKRLVEMTKRLMEYAHD